MEQNLPVRFFCEAIRPVVHIARQVEQYVTDDLWHLVDEVHITVLILGYKVVFSVVMPKARVLGKAQWNKDGLCVLQLQFLLLIAAVILVLRVFYIILLLL